VGFDSLLKLDFHLLAQATRRPLQIDRYIIKHHSHCSATDDDSSVRYETMRQKTTPLPERNARDSANHTCRCQQISGVPPSHLVADGPVADRDLSKATNSKAAHYVLEVLTCTWCEVPRAFSPAAGTANGSFLPEFLALSRLCLDYYSASSSRSYSVVRHLGTAVTTRRSVSVLLITPQH
jgi:hypothetical protein